MKKYDVIIVGAGAAGLMCALRAGQRGKRVLLLEHTDKIGAKILISGGGRCNFTNRAIMPDRFLSQNPHFCKSALSTYTQYDFIDLIEKHKVPYHEKTLGQLFCDNSAKDIVTILQTECCAAGVQIALSQHILSITKAETFQVELAHETILSSALVMATGGLSIPKMGATGFTYQIAQQFRIPLTERRPGLVPLTFEDEELDFIRPLSGISLEVTAQCGKQLFHESMVMTHRGLSGPAILQISSYWREGLPISLDLMPGRQALDFLMERKVNRPKAELKSILGEIVPHRLAQAIAAVYFVNDPIGTIPNKSLIKVAGFLKDWRLIPSGTEGYAKAEVTLGGVDTNALSSKTMMVKQVPGLYVIGEAVDVTGWLGGYNFQWAWSSGYVAGSAL